MTSQPLFQNTFILRKPRLAISNYIIKILTMFIKKIFKDSKKSRKNHKLFIKMQSISVFLDIAKFAYFRRKNADISRTQEVCHAHLHTFWIFFR